MSDERKKAGRTLNPKWSRLQRAQRVGKRSAEALTRYVVDLEVVLSEATGDAEKEWLAEAAAEAAQNASGPEIAKWIAKYMKTPAPPKDGPA